MRHMAVTQRLMAAAFCPFAILPTEEFVASCSCLGLLARLFRRPSKEETPSFLHARRLYSRTDEARMPNACAAWDDESPVRLNATESASRSVSPR